MRVLIIFTVLAAFALQTGADPVPGVFNSGVDDTGTLLDNSALDPHYRLAVSADPAAPGPDVFTLDPGFPVGPWIEEGPTSRWIAPSAAQGVGNVPGDYTFRLPIDLTGFDESTMRIEGLWAADNTVKIVLNGVDKGIANNGGFGGFADFLLDSGFVAGLNHLDFIVNNAVPGVNPIGLRVEMFSDATALPAGTPLTIITQPATNIAARATGSATLRVVAHGSAPVTYQWYKGSQAITGETNAELAFIDMKAEDQGAYSVRITNAVNNVTSSVANVTVKDALEVSVGRYVKLTLEGSTGRPHRIDYVDALTGPEPISWNTLTNLTLGPNPRSVLDEGSPGVGKRYYRAVRLPEEQ